MENKYTPGPWEASDRKDEYKGIMIDATDVVNVAVAYGLDDERAEANARLIAAAPTMVEVLVKLLNCPVVPGSELWAVQFAARKAIAAALYGSEEEG